MALNNILNSGEIIGIYIGNTNIKIIIGNENKIRFSTTLKTPENSVIDDTIQDVDAIAQSLKTFLQENKVKVKNVGFSIQGQEIIVRQLEIPIMPEKNIRSSVEWEINQYLPNDGADHYIDFEILDKLNNNDKKVFKILVAAVPKEKIDKYLILSEMLDLKLKIIDLTAICVARLFKNVVKKNKDLNSIGIIDIGNKNSSIVIIENGKLFMEKAVPFGLFNVQREIIRKLGIDSDEALNYLYNTLDLNDIKEEDEVTKRIQTIFDNLFSSFTKIIQFYATGKSSKKLDRIYLTGGGNLINGLEEYVKGYFETETVVPSNLKALNIKTNASKDFDLKFYTNLVGLLLRKE